MPGMDKQATEKVTGRPKGGSQPPDERREAILAAACRAILRRGFHATRIADIAREAGTSTGTVHYHFETKDDVLTAALKWANEQPYVRMDELLGRDADEVSRLAAAWRCWGRSGAPVGAPRPPVGSNRPENGSTRSPCGC